MDPDVLKGGTEVEWQQIIQWSLMLLGGGAAGALITVFVSARRNRIQPIGFRIDLISIFKGVDGPLSVKTLISVKSEQVTHNATIDNLAIYRVTLQNVGNTDYTEFKFGAAIAGESKFVHMEYNSKDYLHKVERETVLSPAYPSSPVTLVAKPFNRNDIYIIDLYADVHGTPDAPATVSLSTVHPVTFVDRPTTSERLSGFPTGLIMALGPLELLVEVRARSGRGRSR